MGADIGAVDPLGQVALAGSSSGGCRRAVEKYDLAGHWLWSRNLILSGCGNTSVDTLTISGNHDVVLAGSFAGSADFGTGPVQTVGFDAFTIVLKP